MPLKIMLCQTSKVLLGKLKSYETMQGLVFLPLVAKFLMKWRFLLEPIGEFPSVVRTPKIGKSFEALKVIACTIRRIHVTGCFSTRF